MRGVARDFALTNDCFDNKVGLRCTLCPGVQRDHHYSGPHIKGFGNYSAVIAAVRNCTVEEDRIVSGKSE